MTAEYKKFIEGKQEEDRLIQFYLDTGEMAGLQHILKVMPIRLNVAQSLTCAEEGFFNE